VGIGLISYSTYLLHQPLFAFARQRSILAIESEVMLGLCILTLPLAYLSWRYVEKPCLDELRFKTKPVICTTVIAALLIFCAAIAGVTTTEQFRQRWNDPEVQSLFDVKFNKLDNHQCAFSSATTESALTDCFSMHNTVYLFGDSHAGSLSIALRKQLSQISYTLISMTQPGCMMVEGVTRTDLNRKATNRCRSLTAQAVDFARRNPAPIVISARWRINLSSERYDNGEGGTELGQPAFSVVEHDASTRLASHISNELSNLTQIAPLIVVDQIPETGWNVPSVLIKAIIYESERTFSTSYRRYLSANEPVNRMLASVKGNVNIVNTSWLVCDSEIDRCTVQIDGVPLYRDSDHPADLFAGKISEKVLDLLDSKP